MTDEEFKKRLEDFQRSQDQAKMQRGEFLKQTVPGVLKMPLEGFVSSDQKIQISDDLEIEKVSDEVRDEFFQRAASLELRDYKHDNNWFFITYKFKDERGNIGGMDTGSRILLVAIFFSICSEKLLKVNKSQGFTYIQEQLRSIGITRIPNAPWAYDYSANFENENIEDLRRFWPLFRDAYNNQIHFALVARRYYFSLIRNQWEDQLIDLIISLEALLVPEMEEVNKAGKIAKRLSRMLVGKHLRGEVSRVAKNCYDIRNKIVHGKLGFVPNNDFETLTRQLRVYVKTALQIYLLDYRGLSVQEVSDRLEDISGDQI
jgi:hypothetical protein